MLLIIALLITSLIGTAGLRWGTPRPGAQEGWAILAIAPIFMLVAYAAVAL